MPGACGVKHHGAIEQRCNGLHQLAGLAIVIAPQAERATPRLIPVRVQVYDQVEAALAAQLGVDAVVEVRVELAACAVNVKTSTMQAEVRVELALRQPLEQAYALW